MVSGVLAGAHVVVGAGVVLLSVALSVSSVAALVVVVGSLTERVVGSSAVVAGSVAVVTTVVSSDVSLVVLAAQAAYKKSAATRQRRTVMDGCKKGLDDEQDRRVPCDSGRLPRCYKVPNSPWPSSVLYVSTQSDGW